MDYLYLAVYNVQFQTSNFPLAHFAKCRENIYFIPTSALPFSIILSELPEAVLSDLPGLPGAFSFRPSSSFPVSSLKEIVIDARHCKRLSTVTVL
jgi:hypothetical protein